MDTQNVERLLIEALDAFLQESNNHLSFTDEREHAVFWDNNIWLLQFQKADPISILVFDQSPERCEGGDDDIILATAAKMLGQSTWFIRSFLNGWFDQSNRSTSISGYLLGNNLRRKYLK